jgi:hypothetical protein
VLLLVVTVMTMRMEVMVLRCCCGWLPLNMRKQYDKADLSMVVLGVHHHEMVIPGASAQHALVHGQEKPLTFPIALP